MGGGAPSSQGGYKPFSMTPSLSPMSVNPMQSIGALPTQARFQQNWTNPAMAGMPGSPATTPQHVGQQQVNSPTKNIAPMAPTVSPIQGTQIAPTPMDVTRAGMNYRQNNPLPGWRVPYREGINNWRSAPAAGWSGDPGEIDQKMFDYLNKREDVLGNRVQDYAQRMRQGEGVANRRGLGFLRGKLADLRQYQDYRGAPGSTSGIAGDADPNAPGVATDFYGGLSNSAQLLAMLAAQSGG